LLLGSEIFDTLVSFEMIFNEMNFTLIIYPFEGMRRISIHKSVAVRSTSVREKDGDLMECLRGMLPEIEDLVRIGQVCQRISLLRMKEIWELNWIINEEHRSVVANHIVVSLFGVELDGETTRVSYGISGTSLTSYC
jgi:hypothetical protein